MRSHASAARERSREYEGHSLAICFTHHPGRGVLPYIGYIGMCRCEGYGFHAVYSRIGYINQNIWV